MNKEIKETVRQMFLQRARKTGIPLNEKRDYRILCPNGALIRDFNGLYTNAINYAINQPAFWREREFGEIK